VQPTRHSRNDGGRHLPVADRRSDAGLSGRQLAAIVARVYPSVRVVLRPGNPAVADESGADAPILAKPCSGGGDQ